MKKNITTIMNFITMCILIFFVVQILLTSDKVMSAVEFSFSIWKSSIFPSLFPFFITSSILINYGFVEIISEVFKPLMNRLFKVNGACAFIFIMSLISGFPSSAKYTKELYINELIDEKEGTKILMFTHFSNPLFILGTISLTFLNNKEVGLLILIIHYLTNIIIGLIIRNLYPSKNDNQCFSFNNVVKVIKKRKKNFGEVLSNAIKDTINTLLLILGTVTIFLIVTTIIDNIINITPYYQAILNGTIEMTQGLKYISILDLPLKIKAIISTMFISFGGISVHMQIISILNDTKIKYFPYLIARIFHSLIAGLLVFLTFDLWVSIL